MNGLIRFDQLSGERFIKHSVRKQDSKIKKKPKTLCLRNYQNRERDVYDTLHVKEFKQVSTLHMIILSTHFITKNFFLILSTRNGKVFLHPYKLKSTLRVGTIT